MGRNVQVDERAFADHLVDILGEEMDTSTVTIHPDAGGSITVGYGAGYIRLQLSNGDQGPDKTSVSLHLSSVEARRLACHLAAANSIHKSESQADADEISKAFSAWGAVPPLHSAVHLMLQRYGKTNVLQAIEISGKVGKAGVTGYVIAVAKRLKEERDKRHAEIAHAVKTALEGE